MMMGACRSMHAVRAGVVGRPIAQQKAHNTPQRAFGGVPHATGGAVWDETHVRKCGALLPISVHTRSVWRTLVGACGRAWWRCVTKCHYLAYLCTFVAR